jgi:hypothetical protein
MLRGLAAGIAAGMPFWPTVCLVSRQEDQASKGNLMADDGPEGAIDPRISPYLRRPLRSLKMAEQDNDALRRRWASVPSAEPVPAVPRSSTSMNSGTEMSRARERDLEDPGGGKGIETSDLFVHYCVVI